jgi:hypothetical protein
MECTVQEVREVSLCTNEEKVRPVALYVQRKQEVRAAAIREQVYRMC